MLIKIDINLNFRDTILGVCSSNGQFDGNCIEFCKALCFSADYQTAPDDVAASLGIVCGSRAHLEEQAISSRSYFRTLLMYGFHFLVWLFSVRGIRDTQCGFKLFTRETARLAFGNLHVERW